MIREATIDDMDFLLMAGQSFFDSVGFPKELTFDKDVLKGVLTNLIDNENAVIYVDGKCRGAIGGIIYPYYFTGQKAGNEMFWWVDPDHRKGLGKKLLDKLEAWAKEKGALSFTMISLESSEPEKMHKVYKARGYTPVEHHYTRIL